MTHFKPNKLSRSQLRTKEIIIFLGFPKKEGTTQYEIGCDVSLFASLLMNIKSINAHLLTEITGRFIN